MFLFEEFGGSPINNRFRVQWFKVGPGQSLTFTCKSVRPLALGVHWLRRVILCPGQEVCPLCSTHSGRVNYYLFTGTSRNIGCLEIGEASWLKLCDQWEKEGKALGQSLLGRKFSLVRAAKNKGLQVSEITPATECSPREAIDLVQQIAALRRLFSLPNQQLIDSPSSVEQSFQEACLAASRQAAAEFERLQG